MLLSFCAHRVAPIYLQQVALFYGTLTTTMYLMEHVFECSVIVVWVRRRDFVGEERRRVQELHVGLGCGLVEVVGLGLITCGQEEVVGGVRTLVAGVVQVYHRLHVVEEEEKGAEGRARRREGSR